MIIRVQSPVGTKKFDVSERDLFDKLLSLVSTSFELRPDGGWFLSTSHDAGGRLRSTASTRLSKFGLKHGDMLFLVDPTRSSKPKSSGGSQLQGDFRGGETDGTTTSRATTALGRDLVEDRLDQELDKMDGQIKRKRNEQYCHHPQSGQCIHCVPLEPYDPAYLEHLDPPVKFMSFHAYLRKLSGGQANGKFVTLENLSYRVRPGCHEHAPWPDGICTKCQPSPVTLEIQPYRHVDYVQFENGQLMETFLDYWRQTGRQRIGLMLGRYAHFDTAGSPPLAIKAVVVAVYEPLQESTARSVKLTAPLNALMPDHVSAVARRLGLRPVGWIFTDLVAEDRPNMGEVKHYRGSMDTFFLSAEECITAAHLQNIHPNICCHSPDGHFGSKFVTVVVTGDENNHIRFEAYQVSNQAMALERDNILVPTYDAPELGYIRETTRQQFVPEVFYTLKDKYGNRVTRIARPLPVEYLLVDMPAAFPMDPVFTLAKFPEDVPADIRFPVENREDLGQIQDFPAFARLLRKFGSHRLYSCLANFHLLAWLAGNDGLPLNLRDSNDDDVHGLAGLLDAITIAMLPDGAPPSSAPSLIENAERAVAKWASESAGWATIEELRKAVTDDMPSSPLPGIQRPTGGSRQVTSVGSEPMETAVTDSGGREHWSCSHCTFHNKVGSSECEMCGLPRDQ
ncbi:unnamed protein product [Calicophoron daubneyi]|uniref:Nuclear protein localization protein 4 n=1 Tax=Calicophoron daubneyi TaxID=300641 RepID=A0AAV2TIV6_CALDB